MRVFILSFLILIGCSDAQKQDKKHGSDFGTPSKTFKLPVSLNEISGLALNSKNQLFGHNDEVGVIYQIDINSGKVVKNFQLGRFGLEGDFEGLAIAGERFFILESNGMLYEFREGKNNERVEIKTYNLGFSSKFEFEGLCYDKKNNGLLIACKGYIGKKYEDEKPIFFFSLVTNRLESKPKFLIKLGDLKKHFRLNYFYPSGIEISPSTGNIFVLSSKGETAVIELSPEGKILSAWKLNKKYHLQPEGIALLPDGTIIIADEKVKEKATLSFYSNKEK